MDVQRCDEEHDQRLDEVLTRLECHGITRNTDKGKLGQPQVKWIGFVYSEQRMSNNPEIVQYILDWKYPPNKSEVRIFIQAVAFSQTFMRPDNAISFSDITVPLTNLTKTSVPFKWTEPCEKAFFKIKYILSSDNVLASFKPERETRVYVGHGHTGFGLFWLKSILLKALIMQFQ